MCALNQEIAAAARKTSENEHCLQFPSPKTKTTAKTKAKVQLHIHYEGHGSLRQGQKAKANFCPSYC